MHIELIGGVICIWQSSARCHGEPQSRANTDQFWPILANLILQYQLFMYSMYTMFMLPRLWFKFFGFFHAGKPVSLFYHCSYSGAVFIIRFPIIKFSDKLILHKRINKNRTLFLTLLRFCSGRIKYLIGISFDFGWHQECFFN